MNTQQLKETCIAIARYKGIKAFMLTVDRLIFVKEGGQTLFIDFPGDEITPEQRRFSKFCGYSHYFIRNTGEFEQLIKIYFGEG